jgi:hypothetical protein
LGSAARGGRNINPPPNSQVPDLHHLRVIIAINAIIAIIAIIIIIIIAIIIIIINNIVVVIATIF